MSWDANASPRATEDPTKKSATFEPNIVLRGSLMTWLRQIRLDTDTAAPTVHKTKPAANQMPSSLLRWAIRAHRPVCESVRVSMPTKTVASRTAPTMAVFLTEDARSTGDRARMMWIARVPVVGSNAIAPSAAERAREIAILPVVTGTWCAEVEVEQSRLDRGW